MFSAVHHYQAATLALFPTSQIPSAAANGRGSHMLPSYRAGRQPEKQPICSVLERVGYLILWLDQLANSNPEHVR